MTKIEKWAARVFDDANRLLAEKICVGEVVARIEGDRLLRRQNPKANARLFIAPTGEFFE
ncbi:hypothetical protein G6L26_009575 [Agrobacterium radiobacter]|uniref:hypothetical protein n=1 Tax=Agrobacterium tumefaciens complex TaxID=1183400 RepID=UPI001146C6BA|nr:hypothetical protein [Agrobacterium tumefaciens]NTA05434.1 hypothetical protein [Agrobacterium tumefaciens]NTA92027.1 hypothetical protein [Agrobacterium tumefaciens]